MAGGGGGRVWLRARWDGGGKRGGAVGGGVGVGGVMRLERGTGAHAEGDAVRAVATDG